VLVSKSEKLRESLVGKAGRFLDRLVVDRGYVNQVEYYDEW